MHLVYQNGLEVKNTTEIQKSASYLDIHLAIADRGRLKKKAKLYDKHDDFPIPIVNFPVAIFQQHHLEPVDRYAISFSQMTMDYFPLT